MTFYAIFIKLIREMNREWLRVTKKFEKIMKIP